MFISHCAASPFPYPYAFSAAWSPASVRHEHAFDCHSFLLKLISLLQACDMPPGHTTSSCLPIRTGMPFWGQAYCFIVVKWQSDFNFFAGVSCIFVIRNQSLVESLVQLPATAGKSFKCSAPCSPQLLHVQRLSNWKFVLSIIRTKVREKLFISCNIASCYGFGFHPPVLCLHNKIRILFLWESGPALYWLRAKCYCDTLSSWLAQKSYYW